MTIKTRKGFNIQPVLDHLSQSGNESDDPPRGFGLLFGREKAYLRTAIDAKGLSNSELSLVIEKALREAPKLTQADVNAFADYIVKLRNSYRLALM